MALKIFIDGKHFQDQMRNVEVREGQVYHIRLAKIDHSKKGKWDIYFESIQDENYLQWKLDLIGIIANSGILDGIIREEIKVIARDESCVSESFRDGDTPDDYWQGEHDAIKDSQ